MNVNPVSDGGAGVGGGSDVQTYRAHIHAGLAHVSEPAPRLTGRWR